MKNDPVSKLQAWVLWSVLFLVLTGITVISGLSENPNFRPPPGTLAGPLRLHHMGWACAGFVAMYLAARLEARRWRDLALPLLLFTVLCMSMVLVPGLGYSVRGTRRWLPLGPGLFQPAALAMVSLPLFLAWWFDERGCDRLMHGAVSAGVVASVVVLAVWEPDFVSGLVLAISSLLLLRLFGASWSTVMLGWVSGLAFLALSILRDEQSLLRLLGFFHRGDAPCYTRPRWDAILQASWCGAGLGCGQQVDLYWDEAPHGLLTAVIAEDLGWIGLLSIAAAAAALTISGVALARRSEGRFGYLAGVGLLTVIGVQTAMHVMVITDLLPLTATGTGLPFVSFNESGLVAQLAAVGILLSVGKNRTKTS